MGNEEKLVSRGFPEEGAAVESSFSAVRKEKLFSKRTRKFLHGNDL